MNFKIFVYRYNLSNDSKEYTIDIPFYEIVKKINGNSFRKYFIVDIRNLNHSKVIFNNFDDFKSQFLADEFFSLPSNTQYPINLSLCFLYDNNKIVNSDNILHDYNYALVNFINENEYKKIVASDDDLIVTERENIYDYNGKTISTSNFNLIYGFNGSGKTRFLEHISTQEKVPIFLLNKKFDSSNIYLSNSDEYLENLHKILAYCQSKNIPLLLDDLCWNSFDGRNQITIIDTLYAHSHEHNVFFTSAQENIKQLVKKRSHNPNIIDFNR